MQLQSINAFLADYSALTKKHGVCFAARDLWVTSVENLDGRVTQVAPAESKNFDETAEFVEVI